MRTYEDYRNILNLWIQGNSKSCISNNLNIPISTVRSIIRRFPEGLEQLEEATKQGALPFQFDRPKYQFRNYTVEDLEKAVRTSTSLAGVLSKLGIVIAGGNYKTIKDKISKLNLDTSHFLGMKSNKGSKHNHTHHKPLNLILVNGCNYSSTALRERLIKEGYKERKCEGCLNAFWNSQPIALELHHINGINLDNRLENLQILCPNCHAQTPNYRGRKLPQCKQ